VTTVDLHLVERFTRVSDDTLMYHVTVDDPNAWAGSAACRTDSFGEAAVDRSRAPVREQTSDMPLNNTPVRPR
jgi:hypothetical protein